MMKQHTRGLAETKDDDLDGDEEVQACSAWAATWTRVLGPGRGKAGDEQQQSKAEVGVAERCAGKVDVQPERGATLSWSSRARKRWTVQHGISGGASNKKLGGPY
jgi:hypothetical protein